jgi:hypothetical protein
MERVREFSKALFGASYRLEICAALTSGELVTLTTFAATLPTPPGTSSVAKELQTLETCGLLVRQPSVPGMRNVYLLVSDSQLWDVYRGLVEAIGKNSPVVKRPIILEAE